MKLLKSITIPDYPSHYVSSKSTRATYWKKDDNIPKKYLGVGNIYRAFTITRKGKKTQVKYLCTRNGERIVKNQTKVGLEKKNTISGQHVFNTKTNAHGIGKMLSTIKQAFFQYLEKPTVSFDYPLYLEFIYYSQHNDLDNHRLLYEKAIIDCLKVFEYKRDKDFKMIKVDNPKGFMPEDDTRYVNKLSSEHILSEERKLVLNIYERH